MAIAKVCSGYSGWHQPTGPSPHDGVQQCAWCPQQITEIIEVADPGRYQFNVTRWMALTLVINEWP